MNSMLVPARSQGFTFCPERSRRMPWAGQSRTNTALPGLVQFLLSQAQNIA